MAFRIESQVSSAGLACCFLPTRQRNRLLARWPKHSHVQTLCIWTGRFCVASTTCELSNVNCNETNAMKLNRMVGTPTSPRSHREQSWMMWLLWFNLRVIGYAMVPHSRACPDVHLDISSRIFWSCFVSRLRAVVSSVIT